MPCFDRSLAILLFLLGVQFALAEPPPIPIPSSSAPSPLFAPSPSLTQECVILLHGLARTQRSMGAMAKSLEASGFWVVNRSYPSTKDSIENLSQPAIEQALKQCPKDASVHFVTHSMGGIILRYYLKHNDLPRLSKVVMLGPPNKGSEVVDAMRHVWGFAWFNGPAGMQLGTSKNSMPNSLGAANFNVGIIAGSKSINLLLSNFLPNPDDGKVSVANTKLVGMTEHIVMPVTHTFMMKNREVIKQVASYLRVGHFDSSLGVTD